MLKRFSNFSSLFLDTLLGGVRTKKSMGGGVTRNKCGHPKGKKRGIKVYDGQRVPVGTCLARQHRLIVYPGWNVSIKLLWIFFEVQI